MVNSDIYIPKPWFDIFFTMITLFTLRCMIRTCTTCPRSGRIGTIWLVFLSSATLAIKTIQSVNNTKSFLILSEQNYVLQIFQNNMCKTPYCSKYYLVEYDIKILSLLYEWNIIFNMFVHTSYNKQFSLYVTHTHTHTQTVLTLADARLPFGLAV